MKRSQPRHPTPPRDGHTLLEIAVATLVLSVLAVSASQALVPVSRQTRISREMEVATHAVQTVLERVHSTPFESIPTDYPPGMSIVVDDLPEGQIVVGYEDIAADPLVMDLTLSWTGEAGPISRTLVTVRTK